METALDFLSISPIACEITSLQLSLQIEVHPHWNTPEDAPLKLPWHGRLSTWLQLRDQLPELKSLRSLSIWMDAASQMARYNLLTNTKLFKFDECLFPFLRVSIPLAKLEDETYSAIRPTRPLRPNASNHWPPRIEHLPPDTCVIGRGHAEFWQELDLAPEITWYPNYSDVKLYMTAWLYYNTLASATLHVHPRRLTPRESISRDFQGLWAKIRGKEVKRCYGR